MSENSYCERLRKTWEGLSEKDAMWAVLTDETGRTLEDFFSTGAAHVGIAKSRIEGLGFAFHGDRALDFGCGLGRLCRHLAAHYKTVIGVDISENMLARAKALNEDYHNIEWLANTQPDLRPVPDSTCDLAFSLMVLQHVEPRSASVYLGELCRILKPGGLIYFQVPLERRYADHHVVAKLARTAIRDKAKTLSRNLLGKSGTRMEMHGLPRKEILAVFEKGGVELQGEWADDLAGEDWISLTYCGVKSRLVFESLSRRGE